MESKNPRFHTSTNRYTAYALSCGFIERKVEDGLEVSLWKNGRFHVEAVRVETDRSQDKRVFWEEFDKLSQARDMYDNAAEVAAAETSE